ncbi:MAG: hypothetical protein ACQEQF_06885 [Bacillota bacterium]
MDKIVVSGQASKVGKTTLVEEIIKNLCGDILAIKCAVSDEQINPIISIEEKINENEDKDTGRYLRAGANKAIFIKTKFEKLKKSLDDIKKEITDYDYLIYEGNNLLDFLNSDLVIFLKNELLERKYSADKAETRSDIILDKTNEKEIIFNIESISCYKAHLLADVLGLSVGRIGKLLNNAEVKIKGCQLGLF